MTAYRFCRTDDIGLLVDALNRCWAPHFPGEPLMTPVAFKRSIRDLQVWCSSCMVAFAGSDPVGVLIGAKRPGATLIHRIAVHPDHLRQGHGRHLLTSLSSKLAILGPPRLVAEVPDAFAPACGLFEACGYVEEAVLTDYVREPNAIDSPDAAEPGGFMIPVTIDDLAANGVLEEGPSRTCWERSTETLDARKGAIAGLAVASDERIEAYVLYAPRVAVAADADSAPGATAPEVELLSLRSIVEDGGARVKRLLAQLQARGVTTVRFPKVHPSELWNGFAEALRFRPAGRHRLYAARATAD